MHGQYLITEEQRNLLLGCVYLDNEEENTALNILQSLPELTGEPLQPITANDVTDEMMSYFYNAILSKDDAAYTINFWIKHRGDK